MPLNEQQQTVFNSYTSTIDEALSPRTIRFRLDSGIPETLLDLEGDVYSADFTDRLEGEELTDIERLLAALHEHPDPRSVIAELEYENDADGTIWLVLRKDEDDN
jgi:hypothetical protein